MAHPSILYGPDSEPYNQYAAVSPVPGNNGSGGPIAYRGVQPLGKQLILEDGRKWRFCKAGELLVVANAIQQTTALTTSEDLTAAAGTIGDRIITFTHGAATTAINLFAEGYAVVSVTPGGGDTYKIASHAALTNATAGDIVNLSPGHALRRDLTTTSRVDLLRHPYYAVIQQAVTTQSGMAVGVAVSAIASTYWGWLQTRGCCGVLTDDTVIGGNEVVVPSAAAGACGPFTASTVGVEIPIGYVANIAANTAWSTIYLTIDG